MSKYVELIIGGSIGTIARYLLAGAVYNVMGASFPYGTLAVNLSGCFLIGFLSSLAEEKFLLGSDVRIMLMIGFCGAFTTFSTLILETGNLLRDGEALRAFMNLFVSITAGFLCYWTGLVIGELI